MKNIISETKKHYIYVQIKGNNINNFIKTVYTMNINIYNIDYINQNTVIIKILKTNLKILKKTFHLMKFKIVGENGIYKFKPFLKKHYILITSVIFSVFLLYFMSNIIVKVEVIHSKKEIRELVGLELDYAGIKRLTLKKSYKKIEAIKEELLNKYPTRLEWVEIEVKGMNYVIRVEERILTNPAENPIACNVIANKDAIITKIIAHDGETVRRINNYVRKGDIIISGSIHLNEAIKNTVCATGEVYGEVWYTVSATVPMDYEEHEFTGRKKYNIAYESEKSKNKILRSRFENYDVKAKQFFSVFGIKLFWQTEQEYNVIPKTYSEEEAINRGIELAREKLNVKLNDNEYIIDEKVLKKSIDDSKMELEIFFSVNELISSSEEFTPIENTPE